MSKRGPHRRLSDSVKNLLCYIVCWGVAALWPYIGLRLLYPFKLVGTAPDVALPIPLAPDARWRAFVGASLAVAWLISLILQLVWRARYARPKSVARATRGAARGYRLTLLAVLLVNLAAALWLWLMGARFITGFGLWDALIYFGALPLNVLAAALCSRLAAPPALSGRHAFFKRL